MRKIILMALFAFAIALPATAQDYVICKAVGRLAEKIMIERQDGTPMAQVMEAAKQSTSANPDFADMEKPLTEIILAAYSHPQGQTAQAQTQTIQDFKRTVTKTCYESL